MNVFLSNQIKRYEAQDVLFAERVSRLALQQLDINVNSPNHFTVNVWRNHAIEPLISLCLPYLFYGNLQVNFCVSDYDDTLMFSDHQVADIEFLWLDSSRYLSKLACDDWFKWLIKRIVYLRDLTYAPIIIATWLSNSKNALYLEKQIGDLPMVYFADLANSCSELGIALTNARTVSLAGTQISASAQLLLARKISCQWLPAIILPPIKAVVLDLDYTLHLGVIAEDGSQGVKLTDAHKNLQIFLKSLQKRGIFIALVSRNEKSDVQSLFVHRQDYPLRWTDFSAVEISWGDKADSIRRVADILRISYDAMLFVDDNIGELINVYTKIPQIHTIHASSDPNLTQRTLENYPGLWRWKVELDDKKRLKDLRANSERDLFLASTSSVDDYFRSLQVSLVYRYNPLDQITRLADLCNKTNQFNLAINRFNQAYIASYIQSDTMSVCSVQLKDRLSDSGIIAVIVARRKDEELLIEELCISCRALGRKLEDAIILGAIRGMEIFQDCKRVVFSVQHGSRNQPAVNWLKKLIECKEYPVTGLHSVPSEKINAFITPESIFVDNG